MSNQQHHVVVLGASPKPARYANQAVRLLLQHSYQVTPVHPNFPSIEGLPVAASLAEVTTPVDTLTLYLGAKHLEAHREAILNLQPGRVIFNPGTECELLQQALDTANIEWFEACTLVLLRTNQF